MSKLSRVLISLVFIGGAAFAQTHKGISFQGVIKIGNDYPTRSGITVNARILSPTGCILREESYSGVNISNGYINIPIGKGNVGGYDPGLTMSQVMDNSKVIVNGPSRPAGLVCLDSSGNVDAGVTAFNPASSDGARKFRLSLILDGNPVVADFNMRAVAYAVNSETVNGKKETDFVNINSAQGVTQSNIESIFNRVTQLDALLNNFNASGTAAGINITGNAANVTGVVAIANGGTGATSAASARTNLGLGSLSTMNPTGTADNTTFLRGDGSWAAVNGGVTSVAGRTGVVTLSNTDITGLGTAATKDAGTSAGNVLLLANSNQLPALDGSLLTNITATDNTKVPLAGGTMTGTLNLPSNGLTVGTTQLVVDSGNVGIGTASPGAKLEVNGAMQAKGPGLVPISVIDRGVVAAIGTDTTPGFVQSAAFSSSYSAGQNLGGYRFGHYWTDTARIEAIATEDTSTGWGTALTFSLTPNGTYAKTEIMRIDGTKLEVAGQVKITGGTPGAGKVLTSDASGLASWQTPASGVTSVGASSPLLSSGGTTPTISLDTSANVTFAGLTLSGMNSAGFVKNNASGVLSGGHQIGLATDVTGVLPLANGGTGQNSKAAAFNALSPLTSKGDLVVRDGTGNTRLPAGADYKYLRANSSVTEGLEYSDVTAVDLASVSGTGIVKRTGSAAYTTMGVTAPLIDNGTSLGLSYGNGLTVSAGNLVVDVGTGANQIPQLDANANLQMQGAFAGKAAISNATATINFLTGNNQYTNSDCGAFILNNMKDGATYTFVVKGGTGSTACSFTAYSGNGTGSLAMHMPPDHDVPTAGTHTLYTFIVLGGDVYAAWVAGY